MLRGPNWLRKCALGLTLTPEGIEQIFDCHALAVIGINEACLDPTGLANHKGGWDREHPGIVPLIIWDIPAGSRDQLFHLLADPDRQIQGERVPVIQIRQDWKWRLGVGLEFFGELLP